MFRQVLLFFCLIAVFVFGENGAFADFDLASPPIQRKELPTVSPPSYISHPQQISKRFPLMVPVESKIMWDLCMSPYAGGEDLLFATRLLEKTETYLLQNSPIAYTKTAYARFWRLGELVTIWLPCNYFFMVLQHEVFGHGYRLRDLHTHDLAKVNDYAFEPPPPYGSGSASTSFSISSQFTTTEASAVSSGGVEGTAILALLTKLKWLTSGRIDPRQSLLYFLCEQDLTFYISSLKSKDIRSLAGHDINSYIETLNYTYPSHALSRGRLRSLSWLNFVDPFTFYSIYGWFHYLSSGKETKIPMIAYFYLPGLRLGLTPFGPEVFLENFFSRKNSAFHLYAYIKGGHHAGNTYLGTGVFAPHLLVLKKWSFGLRTDLWHQPKLLLQPGNIPFEEINFSQNPDPSNPLYPPSQQHKMRFGASGSLLASFKSNERCGYGMEYGYKSQGFLPGYSLFSYPTVRLNFSLIF